MSKRQEDRKSCSTYRAVWTGSDHRLHAVLAAKPGGNVGANVCDLSMGSLQDLGRARPKAGGCGKA